MFYICCYRYVKLNIMVYLVKLKNYDKSFYVKISISFTFGIPTGHWIGLEDKIFTTQMNYYLLVMFNFITYNDTRLLEDFLTIK